MLLLIGLTLGVFWPVAGFDFVGWDDVDNVSENKDLNPVTGASFGKFWTEPYRNMYIPVAYTAWGAIALAARAQSPDAFGVTLNPYVFHTVNLALHLGAVLVVYAILSRLVRHRWAACAGAALFAIHPMQVEPVAWVTGLRDLLSGALALLAIWGALAAADQQRPWRRWGFWALATAAFILSMLSKPASLVVPAIAGALLLLLERGALRRMLPGLLIWGALSVACALLTARVQPASGAPDLPLWQRLFVAADALGFYLGQLVFPRHVLIDYSRSPTWLLAHGAWRPSWIVPVALAAAVTWWGRRRPVVGVAALVFVVVLLPVLGFVKFDFQVFSTVADRYLYLALLGPALLAAALLARRPRAWTWSVATVALVLLGARAHAAVWQWRDSETLYARTLADNPRSLAANNGMAQTYTRQGRYADALALYAAALRQSPDDPVTQYNLANTLLVSGQAETALEHYRLALRKLSYPFIYNNYAIALAATGRLDEAVAVLRQALARYPEHAGLHTNLGQVLLRQGDRAGADEQFRIALRLDPGQEQARRALESDQGNRN